MDDLPGNHTEGLILSSFEVLQNRSPEHQIDSILSKGRGLQSSFLDDLQEGINDPHRQHSSTSASSSNSDNSISHHPHQHQHSCGDDDEEEEEEDEENCGNRTNSTKRDEEPVAGDDMFDVRSLNDEDVGQFRGDQALDSLNQSNEFGEDDNSVDSHSRKFRGVDDDDEGDDDDDEDEFEDEETKDSSAASSMQDGNILQENGLETQVGRVHCSATTMTDLQGQPHFIQFPAGTLLSPADGWPSDNCYSSDWHLSVPHASQDLSSTDTNAHAPDILTHGLHRQVEETHTGGQHRQTIQHNLWGVDADDSDKLLVGHNNWSAPKVEEDDDIEDDLEDDEDEEECANVQQLQHLHQQQQHHDNIHGTTSGHWVTGQPEQVEIHHVWPKDIGNVFGGGSALSGPQTLFTPQDCQRSLPGPMPAGAAYTGAPQPKPQAGISPWTLRSQLPTGPPIGAMSRPIDSAGRVCNQEHQQQQFQSAFYCPLSSQGCTATMQVHSPWPHAQGPVHMQPAAAALEPDHQANVIPREHFHTGGLRQHPHTVRCKPQSHLDHNPLRAYTGGDMWKHSKIRAALTQGRYQHHPYLIKEETKLQKDIFPASASNIHSVKASNLVSWYIDYLIHENEHLTQISQAFSLPVNLFHSDDFYFMEALKKKVHFPSLKFLTWMQQHLPSININTVDFHKGRPPSTSSSCTAQSQPTTVGGVSTISSIHPTGTSGGVGAGASVSAAPSCWGGGSFHHPHHMQQQQHHYHHHHHHQLQQPVQAHPLHKQQQQQQEMGSWQNKSRRDIIHDVFFYFQHRRVTCQN